VDKAEEEHSPPAVVGSPLLEGNLLVVVGVDRQTHQAG